MGLCNIQKELESLELWRPQDRVSSEAITIFGSERVFTSTEITEAIFERINGRSYRANNYIHPNDLRYLKLLHYDAEGNIVVGEMICNRLIEAELIAIFRALYEAKYPIERMVLVDEYDADDTRSMMDNNTVAFNYREITGGGKLSKHAFGLAVDINPLYNPYVKMLSNNSLRVEPYGAAPYVAREQNFPYKIEADDLCCRLFKSYGFEWGGEWSTLKDYQHFEK